MGIANHDHAVTAMGSDSFSYDANGNQISRNVSGSSYTLGYDAENRLVSVTGAATATFVYDGDGNRVKATVSGTTTTYIGSYFEWTGSTSTMKKYYYAGGTRVAMRTGSSTINYLLGDHLGSTAITTNSSGVKSAEIRYYPWGTTRYTSGTTPTTFKFTGQRLESGIGLYYYGARCYDPSAGRFVQADSVVPMIVNHADKLIQISVMLIVDFHETSLLMQMNKLNQDNLSYKNIDDNQIKDKGLESALSRSNENDANHNDRGEEEQSNEDFEQLNKIGKSLEDKTSNSTQSDYKKPEPILTSINSTDFDRFAYTSNCPTRYTDPSGHCNVGEAIGGTLLLVGGGLVGAVGIVVFSTGAIALAGLQPEGLGGVAVGGIIGSTGLGIAGFGGYLLYQSGCIPGLPPKE